MDIHNLGNAGNARLKEISEDSVQLGKTHSVLKIRVN